MLKVFLISNLHTTTLRSSMQKSHIQIYNWACQDLIMFHMLYLLKQKNLRDRHFLPLIVTQIGKVFF